VNGIPRDDAVADLPLTYQDLVKQIHDLQERLHLAESDLAHEEITRTTADGLVTVTMRGDGVVTRVAFDQAVFDERDTQSLASRTMAAIGQATAATRSLSAKKIAVIRDSFEVAQCARPL
jgi:DNA-binding protein YbaB